MNDKEKIARLEKQLKELKKDKKTWVTNSEDLMAIGEYSAWEKFQKKLQAIRNKINEYIKKYECLKMENCKRCSIVLVCRISILKELKQLTEGKHG